MFVILFIIVGIAAGFVATRIMEIEADLVTTMALGIGGALIGGLILRMLLALFGVAAGFVGAVLGALLLIWAYRTYIQKK